MKLNVTSAEIQNMIDNNNLKIKDAIDILSRHHDLDKDVKLKVDVIY